MQAFYSRTALLLGEAGVQKLQKARVAVFGLGGVGSWCAEALARAGVGALTLVDKDVVEESNQNRQLVALASTRGMPKAEVMAARVKDISPACAAEPRVLFYLPETADALPLAGYDYIADCIDNISAKVHLVAAAKAAGVRIVSAMGAGNKLESGRLRMGDLAATSVCRSHASCGGNSKNGGWNTCPSAGRTSRPAPRGRRSPRRPSCLP